MVSFLSEPLLNVSITDGEVDASLSIWPHLRNEILAVMLSVAPVVPWALFAFGADIEPDRVGMMMASGGVVLLLSYLLMRWWIAPFQRVRVQADRSGLRVGRRFVPWNAVARVQADTVRFVRDGDMARSIQLRPAIVLHGADRALVLANIDVAEKFAEQLEFLRRTSSGAPEDVPDAIVAMRAAPQPA